MSGAIAAERAAVLAAARRWIGTPYHHHARRQGVGVDCAQLLIAVYHEAGLIPDLRPGIYVPDWHLHRGEEQYLHWVERYGRLVETPEPGDVAVYRFGRCYAHGAIIAEAGAVIHAYLGLGCVVTASAHPPLAGRPVRYYSLWSAA